MPPQGWHCLWLVAEILKFGGNSINCSEFKKIPEIAESVKNQVKQLLKQPLSRIGCSVNTF